MKTRTISAKNLTRASLLLAVLTGTGIANAQEGKYFYQMAIEGNAQVPEWVTINYQYGSWFNNGSPGSCGSWSPITDTVDWGNSFQQDRTCQQPQQRNVTPILLNPILRVTKPGTTYLEDRSVAVAQFQPAVGTRNFINGERANDWGVWVNQGSHYGCAAWSPTPDTVNLYEGFTQSRDCSQDQTRTRQVYNTWADGSETAKRIDSENQTITETEQQAATGSRDFIDGTRIAAWSAWSNSSAPYACGTWSPSPGTINLNQSFTQSRDCSQDQVGDRNVYDVWRSGAETLNRNENREQTVTVTQSQGATGTKDFIARQRNGDWSVWADNGAIRSCTSWSPETSAIDWGDSFTQNRVCKQDQTRQMTVYDVWESGTETVNRVETGNQTLDVPQSRGATGSRDYIASTDVGTWSSWANTGGHHSCGSWGAETSTVNLGQTFNQSRVCSQDQTRSRDTIDVYASGNRVVTGTENGSQSVNRTENRSAVGTKDYIASTRTANWGGWSNTGGLHSCGSWGADPGTVNLGQSFVQNRTCKQDQARSRNVYNVWASGNETLNRTEGDSRSVDSGQTRNATGTKNYITGSANGSWTGYSNSGSVFGCSGWGPSTSTVNYGQSFTQTRSCTQGQVRTRPVYDVWANGAQTQRTTESNSRNVGVTQSRSATGTKDAVTGTSYSSWSGWSNSGGVYSCSGYSPSTGTIRYGQGFMQTRSCSQNQTRSRTVYDVWSSGRTTVRSSQGDSRTTSVTQSRGATGTDNYIVSTSYGSWSGWSNSGSAYSCGSYGPSTGTVNYGQGFTQTRSCSQNQTRSRTRYYNWANGARTTSGSDSDSRTVTATQSRSATGTKNVVTGSQSSAGAWKTTTKNCGGWGPSTSTVNLNQSFSQTRSCGQGYSRTVTEYNVWSNGSTTVKSTSTEFKTENVTESRTATGTKDYLISQNDTSFYTYSSWSCGQWGPDPWLYSENITFTQSRSCTRTKTRSHYRTYTWASGRKYTSSLSGDGSSTSESRTETRTTWGSRPQMCGNHRIQQCR